jgi:hypothetical protein
VCFVLLYVGVPYNACRTMDRVPPAARPRARPRLAKARARARAKAGRARAMPIPR